MNVNGYEIRPGVDLRDADLSGTDLRGADLRWVDLRGAVLRGADLCIADLRGTNLGNSDLCVADLSGADLWGANLSGADLTGCKGLPEIAPFPLDAVLLEGFERSGDLWNAFYCACGRHPQYKALITSHGPYVSRWLIDNACSIRRRVFTTGGKHEVTAEDIRLYTGMVKAGL